MNEYIIGCLFNGFKFYLHKDNTLCLGSNEATRFKSKEEAIVSLRKCADLDKFNTFLIHEISYLRTIEVKAVA